MGLTPAMGIFFFPNYFFTATVIHITNCTSQSVIWRVISRASCSGWLLLIIVALVCGKYVIIVIIPFALLHMHHRLISPFTVKSPITAHLE